MTYRMRMLLKLHIDFYSHASCEAWPIAEFTPAKPLQFLLTCLLRGMTVYGRDRQQMRRNFYSHASCEAWRCLSHLATFNRSISTHMPLARHDLNLCQCDLVSRRFLLTCLLRGMTTNVMCLLSSTSISTHMPLARHDITAPQIPYLASDFYSHASCEAWLKLCLRDFPRL